MFSGISEFRILKLTFHRKVVAVKNMFYVSHCFSHIFNECALAEETHMNSFVRAFSSHIKFECSGSLRSNF